MKKFHFALLASAVFMALPVVAQESSIRQPGESLEAYYARQERFQQPAAPRGASSQPVASREVSSKSASSAPVAQNQSRNLQNAGFEVFNPGINAAAQGQGIGQITNQVGNGAYNQFGGLQGVLGSEVGNDRYSQAGLGAADDVLRTYMNGGQVITAQVANSAIQGLGGAEGLVSMTGLGGDYGNAATAGVNTLLNGGSLEDAAWETGCGFIGGCDNLGGGSNGFGDIFGIGDDKKGSAEGRKTRPPEKNIGAPVLAEDAGIASITIKETEDITAQNTAVSNSAAGKASFTSMANNPAIAAVQSELKNQAQQNTAMARARMDALNTDTSSSAAVNLATFETCFSGVQAESGDGQALIECTSEDSGKLKAAYDALKAAPGSPVDNSFTYLVRFHQKEAACAGGEACALLPFLGNMTPSEALPGTAEGETGAVNAIPPVISADNTIDFTRHAAEKLLTVQADYMLKLSNKYGRDNVREISYTYSRSLLKEREQQANDLLSDNSLSPKPLLQDMLREVAFFAGRNDGAAVRALEAMNKRYQQYDSVCKEVKPHAMYVGFKLAAETELAAMGATQQSGSSAELDEATEKLQEVLTALEGDPQDLVYPAPEKVLQNNPSAEISAEDVKASLSLMKAVLGCQINHYSAKLELTPYDFFNKIHSLDDAGLKKYIRERSYKLAGQTAQQLYAFNRARTELVKTSMSEFMTLPDVGGNGLLTMRTPEWVKGMLLTNMEYLVEVARSIPGRVERFSQAGVGIDI